MNSQRLKCQTCGLHEPAPGPLSICYSCRSGVFVGHLKGGSGVTLTRLPALGALPSLDQSQCEGFALSNCVLFCQFSCVFLETCSFLKENREGVNLGEIKGRGIQEKWKEGKL